ncbi:MAG: flagellar hook assembly protein FlgD [Nitrospirota bacterium]|jgi:flagellar basal-body rod modification protein FlgD
MEVQNTLAAAVAPTLQSAGADGNHVDKLEFLELLTTQLQYQDPLDPMDNTAFTAQLAQFSSLEQLTNLNGKFDDLLASQAGLSTLQALGFLGREVEAPVEKLHLDDGGTLPLRVELMGDAERVAVTITDDAGKVVSTVDLGALPQGQHHATWDGMTRDGSHAAAGDYHLAVSAMDGDGNPITSQLLGTQTVTGVDLSGSEPWLLTSHGRTPISAINELYQ